ETQFMEFPRYANLAHRRCCHRPGRSETTKQGQRLAVGAGLGFLRRLDGHRDTGEPSVVQQPPERVAPEVAAADLLVAVEPRAEGLLRVVQVKRAHAAKTDQATAGGHRLGVDLTPPDVIAGRVEMTRVQTDADPLGVAYRGQDGRQFLEAPSDGRSPA